MVFEGKGGAVMRKEVLLGDGGEEVMEIFCGLIFGDREVVEEVVGRVVWGVWGNVRVEMGDKGRVVCVVIEVGEVEDDGVEMVIFVNGEVIVEGLGVGR